MNVTKGFLCRAQAVRSVGGISLNEGTCAVTQL